MGRMWRLCRRVRVSPQLLALLLCFLCAPGARAQSPDANDGPLQANADLSHRRALTNGDRHLFPLAVDIEKGEYGDLPPGSPNMPGIANAGKIFTFSIRE